MNGQFEFSSAAVGAGARVFKQLKDMQGSGTLSDVEGEELERLIARLDTSLGDNSGNIGRLATGQDGPDLISPSGSLQNFLDDLDVAEVLADIEGNRQLSAALSDVRHAITRLM